MQITIEQLGLTFNFKNNEVENKNGDINTFESEINPCGIEVQIIDGHHEIV